MMDARGYALIARIVSMGSASLLQYVNDSVPYAAAKSAPALQKIQAIAKEERERIANFLRLLQKQHLRRPALGAYPSHFTTINFVSIDYLIPRLITEHEREVAELQAWLQGFDDEAIRFLAVGYLDLKTAHLKTLKELVTPASA